MSDNLFKHITVEQFKAYFLRDFPFLPEWDVLKTYWLDDIAYYEDVFYKSLTDDNIGNSPTDTANWQKVKGDKYAYVTDDDISKAMTQAIVAANPDFGEDCAEKTNIYLHLVAFYLVFDLKNAASGVNGTFTGILSSKHVGDVSESYSIPQWMLNNPQYSIFAQNGYGLKYLSLIAPYAAITVRFSFGRSTIG